MDTDVNDDVKEEGAEEVVPMSEEATPEVPEETTDETPA
jgi:hypothetical protein